MIQREVRKPIRPFTSRYLVITMEGVRFAEKWCDTQSIPVDKMRLFQSAIKLISTKGVMPMFFAKRWGYNEKLLEQASSKGYVEITGRLKGVSNEVQHKVLDIMSEATREVYA